jgi:putative sterol carrier protein
MAKLADAQAAILGRVVDGISDHRIDRVMRGPLRRHVLRGVFRELPRRLEPGRAAHPSEFEFSISGRRDGGTDRYRVVVADGGCRVLRDPDGAAALMFEIEPAPFLRLVTGQASPMQLYMTGQLRVQGDVMGAARLQTLFRIPRR